MKTYLVVFMPGHIETYPDIMLAAEAIENWSDNADSVPVCIVLEGGVTRAYLLENCRICGKPLPEFPVPERKDAVSHIDCVLAEIFPR